MKKKILITIIGLGIILSGCKDKIEKSLPGTWQIQSYLKNGQNLEKPFYSNVIIMRKIKTVELPINNWDYRHTNKEHGNWSFDTKNNSLTIGTTNELFKGIFHVEKIWKTHDNIGGGSFLNLKLSSSEITLHCRKDLTDTGF